MSIESPVKSPAASTMSDSGLQQLSDLSASDSQILLAIISALENRDPSTRERLLRTVETFFEYRHYDSPNVRFPSEVDNSATPTHSTLTFSEDRRIQPKEFLFEKRPNTDVERVTCLAYYLTHYRDTRYFKTIDVSKLNTEAAQIKLSNATAAVDNATRAGLLVPATKGNKQLSALGELYVQALPDREAAKAAIAHARPRRKSRKGVTTQNSN